MAACLNILNNKGKARVRLQAYEGGSWNTYSTTEYISGSGASLCVSETLGGSIVSKSSKHRVRVDAKSGVRYELRHPGSRIRSCEW
jgi:hypothetical protein